MKLPARFGFMLVTASLTSATHADDRLLRALDCQGLADTERLACFDAIFAVPEPATAETPVPLATQTSEPASVSVSVNPATAAEPEPGQSPDPARFGLRRDGGDPVEFIESVIVEVAYGSLGEDTIRLENGHVWREIDDGRIRYEVGRSVRIESGFMGSFNLKMDGVNRRARVKRVR